MGKLHLTPAGAVVAQCADEDACMVTRCEVCLKEVPGDAVNVADAQDYVHHFCGLDCLDLWRRQGAAAGKLGAPEG
ncbi:MAG: DUF3330 domain-containing protein [Thiobacillus sp.]|nr:DUF3330 domain-containing protein [Thiobacillus sp.]